MELMLAIRLCGWTYSRRYRPLAPTQCTTTLPILFLKSYEVVHVGGEEEERGVVGVVEIAMTGSAESYGVVRVTLIVEIDESILECRLELVSDQ